MQAALVPEVVARLRHPKRPGLAIDWTMFDAVLPGGRRVRYQVLRIAVPRRGRALPLLQAACAGWLGIADANGPAGDDDELIELVAVVHQDVVEPFDPKF